jgi:hypothetical protein
MTPSADQDAMDAGAAPSAPSAAAFAPSTAAPSSDLVARAAELGAMNAGPAPAPPTGAGGYGAPTQFVTSVAEAHALSEGLSAGPGRTGP